MRVLSAFIILLIILIILNPSIVYLVIQFMGLVIPVIIVLTILIMIGITVYKAFKEEI